MYRIQESYITYQNLVMSSENKEIVNGMEVDIQKAQDADKACNT